MTQLATPEADATDTPDIPDTPTAAATSADRPTTADPTTPDAETLACPAATRYPQTARNTGTRYRERFSYDRPAVHAVLDEALVCHVAFILDDAPVVLPTVHARVGDRLYIHGSSGGRWATLDGQPIGITVTLLDGLALGRSWMHHSAPFRCVVVHGTAQIVEDEDERFEAMRALIDHVAPGRSAESRPPNRRELAATTIVAVDLAEVSLKVRDLDLPHWAGVVPLRLVAGEPVPAADLRPGIPIPDHLVGYSR
jgi:nitroimidazol reductase NimA-like FMN-containing flavoprotein (pyridoxamine 5'-phosphate oxidase superfamily)